MESPHFLTAMLRRMTSTDEYRLFVLDKAEVTVGRAKDNSFVIPDLLLSRRHAIFRFEKDQWTVENVGMNGTALNHISIAKNQKVPLQHEDTVEFGAGSKFIYCFQLQEISQESQSKKMRIPLSNRNYSSIRASPEVFNSWIKSKKNLERTLVEEGEAIDQKLEEKKTLENRLMLEQQLLEENSERVKKEMEERFADERRELEEKVARGELEKNELQREKRDLEERVSATLREFQEEYTRKTLELESSVTQANSEKEALLEQKEFVVQQLMREKQMLQENLEEERRLKAMTESELTAIKNDYRKLEEEKRLLQQKGNEENSRLRQIEEALAKKNREIADFQSRNAIGLEMYDAMQYMQLHQVNFVEGGTIVNAEPSTGSNQAQNSNAEVERLVQEKIRKITENSYECGICSELIVVAISLNCMHTFCQYCVNEWKKNKVECPVCRKPITSEFRHHTTDRAIEGLVNELSEEERNRRKQLVAQRQEMVKGQEAVLASAAAGRNQALTAAYERAQIALAQTRADLAGLRSTGARARPAARRPAEPRHAASHVMPSMPAPSTTVRGAGTAALLAQSHYPRQTLPARNSHHVQPAVPGPSHSSAYGHQRATATGTAAYVVRVATASGPLIPEFVPRR